MSTWRSVTVVLTSELAAAALAADVARALCARMMFSVDAVNEVELGVVEAVNNVVEHAYAFDATRQLVLSFDVDAEAMTLTVTLTDQGKAIPQGRFAGAKLPTIDPDDRDALPERGMGLALVKLTMDRVDYRTEMKCNVLTMVKRVSSAGTAVVEQPRS